MNLQHDIVSAKCLLCLQLRKVRPYVKFDPGYRPLPTEEMNSYTVSGRICMGIKLCWIGNLNQRRRRMGRIKV